VHWQPPCGSKRLDSPVKYSSGPHAGHATHSESAVAVQFTNCCPAEHVRAWLHVPHTVFANVLQAEIRYSSRGSHSLQVPQVLSTKAAHAVEMYWLAPHGVHGMQKASAVSVHGLMYCWLGHVGVEHAAHVVSISPLHPPVLYWVLEQGLQVLQKVSPSQVADKYCVVALQSVLHGTHRGGSNVVHSVEKYSPVGQSVPLIAQVVQMVSITPSQPPVAYCPLGHALQAEQIVFCVPVHPPLTYCPSSQALQSRQARSPSCEHPDRYSPCAQEKSDGSEHGLHTVFSDPSQPALLNELAGHLVHIRH